MPPVNHSREAEKKAQRARLQWASEWEIELPQRCPECASLRIAPIGFGLPNSELEEAALRGEVILGGCLCYGDERDPRWGCLDCGCRSTETGDELIKFACERSGAALEQLALELGPDGIGEKYQLQPAFREALCERVGDRVLREEKTLKLPGWSGDLRGIDITVQDEDGLSLRYLCELKWCQSRVELGWTLWDIYKMVAATQFVGVRGCYVVAGAPEHFWKEESHCAPLFAGGIWRSFDLFQRFREDWKELLEGGSARLIYAPASIETRVVADVPLMMKSKPWRLRAIAVKPEFLLFDGDWPVGMGVA